MRIAISNFKIYLDNINNKLITGILALILVVYVVITFLYAYIGPDASYYLKIAFDLSNGVSFYSDMNVAYNPLGIYIFSLLFYIFPDAGYYIINTYFLIFYLANGFLFFKNLKLVGNNKALNIQITLILIISLYVLQGSDIYLEPIVLMFVQTSLYLLLKWELKNKKYLLIFVGTNIFLAFFSKQYGLFIIPAVLYFIYINSNTKLNLTKNLFAIFIGFAIPLIILFTYFSIFKSINVVEFIGRIIGINYLTGSEIVTGVNYHFLKFLETTANFFIKVPIVIFIFYAAFSKNVKVLTSKSLFYIIIGAGASGQLFFASYFHYYQLIIPFCLLLIANIISETHEVEKVRLLKIFRYLSLLFIITTLYWITNDFIFYNKYHKEQSLNKQLLQNVINEKEKVYLQGISPSYYFICKYLSPNYKELGYKFAEELSLKKINESLPEGSYIIIEPSLLEFELFINDYELVSKIKLVDDKECIILRKKAN